MKEDGEVEAGATEVDEAGDQIVYVKERPIRKLLIVTTSIIVGACVFLFVVGFVMALAGVRPPTFDTDIIGDQWDRTVGGKAASYEECVEKGGEVQEISPPNCTWSGEVFTQTQAEACSEAPYSEACRGEEPEPVEETTRN